MRLPFFLVPVQDANEAAMDLKRFLAANRILAVDRHLLANGTSSAWAVCVTLDEGNRAATGRLGGGRRSRVDYKDTLTPPEFAVFAQLGALRKDRANAEGVLAYAFFTDEQLAAMEQRCVTSLAALRRPGFKSRSEAPHLIRGAFKASPVVVGDRRDATEAGVLIRATEYASKARRPFRVQNAGGELC